MGDLGSGYSAFVLLSLMSLNWRKKIKKTFAHRLNLLVSK